MLWAISSPSSGLSLSGPAALSGLRLFKSFNIPLTVMSMFDKPGVVVRYSCGTVPGSILPESTKYCTFIWLSRARLRGDLGVNTDKNCALCTFALPTVSVVILSSSFSGGVPCWSCLEFFKKVKSFLLSQNSPSPIPRRLSKYVW